ncbi:MAG: PEP-CTERM sorting domain-containing protein [Burkholderiales bacterium]|nr:PEP-CTERM sorting domain-containing protein [Burkholderiales bacterium]
MKFERPAVGSGVDRAWLALNFYYGAGNYFDVGVHAYGTNVGSLSPDDALDGVPSRYYSYVGSLQGSAAAEGEEIYFDVTDVVKATGSPYLAFVVQSGSGVVVLSSLEANYGHASQLILTQVPEPSEAALMAAGLLGLAAWLRRRAARVAAA